MHGLAARKSVSQTMIWFKGQYKSRHEFLLTYIKPGKILNVGNLGVSAGGDFNLESHNLLIEFLNKNYPDSELIGMDVHAAGSALDIRSTQVLGDICNPPFGDLTFDTIYMGEVIEHLISPYDALKQAYRILKEKGILIIDTPNPYSLDRCIKWLLARKESLGDPTHRIFFTPLSLMAILEEARFELIEIASDNKVSIGKGMMIDKFLPNRTVRGLGAHLLVAAEKRSR